VSIGAAKGLIATACFNKLATERGLAARATSRGVDPPDALSVTAVAGLKEDGMTVPDARPTAIGVADVTAATHIFAIGCAVPASATESGKAGSWDDVPDDRGIWADARRHRASRPGAD
jgi:protein-tyrosine-phosphatase